MKISLIKTRAPFNALFSINPGVLGAIKEHMESRGYDESQPIVLWDEEGVVVDGHTRLEAARQVGIEDVTVHHQSFADEGAALAYAIHNQRNRRNLTEAEILRCIEAVDKLKERGGDRKSEEVKSMGPSEPIERSAAKTAKITGTSESKVKRVRAVLSDPEVAEEVKAGKISINQGAKKARAKKAQPLNATALTRTPEKPQANTPEQDKRQKVLLQAWTELRAWRQTYGEYQEFAAIITIIDKNYPSKLEPGKPLGEAEGSPLPRELGEPCASSANVEDEAEKPGSPDASDEPPRLCTGEHTTDEPDSPPSEIGDPEPKDQVASPAESKNDGHDLMQCPRCKHFEQRPFEQRPIKSDGLGNCKVYPKFFWKGQQTLCPRFDAIDSAEPNDISPQALAVDRT